MRKNRRKIIGLGSWFLFFLTGSQVLAANGSGQLETMIGAPGLALKNGVYQEARFGEPEGLDIRNGSLLVADTGNGLLRSCYGNRVVTQAGVMLGRDLYGYAWGGYRDSYKLHAVFNKPVDCAYYSGDTFVIADRDNHAIRMSGNAWTYCIGGTGEAGYREASRGYEALFCRPSGVAVGVDQTVYVADTGNHCIRILNRQWQTALLAGTPEQGGFADGAVGEALFMEPSSVAVAADGTVYVCDTGNQRIRRIKDGQVTTLSGSGLGNYQGTGYLNPGYRDGAGTEALFRFPQGLCLAGEVVVVADTGNHVIRAVSPEGITKTIAGSGQPGQADGTALTAQLDSPGDVAWEDGILYIADTNNSQIRKLDFDPEEWLRELEEAND